MRSTHGTFAGRLRAALAEMRVKEPDPDEDLFLMSAVMQDDRRLAGGKTARGVHSLYLNNIGVFRGPEVELMAGEAIATMRDLVTDVQNEFVRLRAGGIASDGVAAVFPSPPDPHLPTLTAALVRLGAGYLGDELANVDPVLTRVHPLTLPLLLDPGDMALFPELSARAVATRRRGSEHPPRQVVRPDDVGAAPAPATPLGWVIFPEFQPGAETRLEPVGGSDWVFRMVQACLNMHVWQDRALIFMRDLLDVAAVCRLVVGSIPDAAEMVLEAVSESRTRSRA